LNLTVVTVVRQGLCQGDKILKPNTTAETKFNDKTQTPIDVDLKLKEAG